MTSSDAEIVAWFRARLANDRALSWTTRAAYGRAADALDENVRLRALLGEVRGDLAGLVADGMGGPQAFIDRIDTALRKPDAGGEHE